MYGYGCYDPCGLGYAAPGYAAPVAPRGTGFALIVVLFILLIIVGASWYPVT